MISVGDRFGDLNVIETKTSKRYGKQWFHRCVCVCGKIKEYSGCHLSTGATKGCGCRRDKVFAQSRFKHGYTGTRTYKIWKGIKKRCYNEKDQAYKKYGGAGILMCEEWKADFRKFISDMGECPEGLTIDRIDGSKGYFPENCRWATYQEQARNTKKRGSLPRGIRRLPSGRYAVQICTNYKNRYIGSYDTLEVASEARKNAEIKYWQ